MGAARGTMIAVVVRFLVVSAVAYALAAAFPSVILAGPAWLAWLVAPALGQPSLTGAAIAYPHAGLIEDPYVLAGIPLFLGLWAAPAKRAWWTLPAGVSGVLAFAGITIALVGSCVVRGFIATPSREPLELAALTAVALVRILPVLLWIALARAPWPNLR